MSNLKNPNALKGYRTLILNGVAFATAMLAVLGVEVLPDEGNAVTLGAIALVNIGLRIVTNTSLGQRN